MKGNYQAEKSLEIQKVIKKEKEEVEFRIKRI